jgi:glucosamine-6-phosphate deaminase
MIPVYRELVRLHRKGEAPLRRARIFLLDELRVPAGDPRSFRRFVETRLLGRVENPALVSSLAGDAPDPRRECARYERALARSGPVDLALVGVGPNGHVAYLEPGQALAPRTSVVRLSAATRRRLRDEGTAPVPREALTIGLETLLESRAILLVATGRDKAAAVAAALEGSVGPSCPASYLSLHPRLTVLLDRAAASRVGGGRRGAARSRPSAERPGGSRVVQ